MLSPCFLVLLVSVRCHLFRYLRFVVHCRCIAISAHLLSFSFFLLAAGVSVFIIALPYHLHGSGLFISLLQPLQSLQTPLSAWTVFFFIHCIIITRIFPSLVASLLDAVISVILHASRPDHAIIDLPSFSGDWRHVIERCAEKMSLSAFSSEKISDKPKLGMYDDSYRDPKTLPTLFLTAPVRS